MFLGCLYIFLPPYSPDYSSIEESFSCRMFVYLLHLINNQNVTSQGISPLSLGELKVELPFWHFLAFGSEVTFG
jgi:hypothetical protein